MFVGRRVFPLCVSLFLAATPAFASFDKPESVTVPPPPPGKAEVVFFRAGGFAGSAISCAVREGDTKISSLPPGRFFIMVAEPGKHTYASTSSSSDGVYLTLNAGEIHYVRCSIHTGFWAGKGSLDVAKDEEFTSKLWKSVDPSRISPSVLTDEQIKAANSPQASAPPSPSAPPSAAATSSAAADTGPAAAGAPASSHP